jgi:subtilisin family serine protease
VPDDSIRQLRSISDLPDDELVARFRRLFQTAQETPPDTPAWYELEIPATIIGDELRRRSEKDKPDLDPARLWQQWQQERGDPQLRIGSEPFTPAVLDRTVIAVPLLREIEREPDQFHDVIIDLNLDFPGGQRSARDQVETLARELHLTFTKPAESAQFMYGRLTGLQIREIVRKDQQAAAAAGRPRGAIYHLWPDFPIRPLITKSVSTVKGDAARLAFSAIGRDIVWAVIDSGIDPVPHFTEVHKNLDLPYGLRHRNFTGKGDEYDSSDGFGHGTHVAGILAGERRSDAMFVARRRDENGNVSYEGKCTRGPIQGVAPECRLLSLKVLDETGNGKSSSVISALGAIQELNGYGRRILVQGVNLSVGYNFEPEWFACGESPLCVEVNRLVRSGVVVVVAAGNTGYGFAKSAFRGMVAAGMSLTINDPGNAEHAITVGSTHRDMPHVYGVSYFSSKGPTGDGRAKPDLVAPGEKILSCAAGKLRADALVHSGIGTCDYTEDSGTSMAAPHVSGVIAAFLSVRREFIGRPEEVKQIFVRTATDLGRDRYFQGAGLVDLMRAIQSV